MTGKMARNKGQRGERELCEFLMHHLSIEEVSRNLEQTRDGGADILHIPGLAIEVKRQENLSIPAWWRQAVDQALNTNRMPVLAFRQNRKSWRFCLPASLIIKDSWGYLELPKDEFVNWLQDYFKNNS